MSQSVGHGVDWELLTLAGRPNGLVIGSGPSIDTLLASLRKSLIPPVFRWPVDGAPWCASVPFRTLILNPVDALLVNQQERLLEWMTVAGSNVQIVSAASAALFPLVERRRFLETLYYRLNVVYVDADCVRCRVTIQES